MSRLPVMVSTYGPLSVGVELAGAPVGTSSGAWIAADRAIYVPLYVPAPAVVVKLWWLNGTSVSGNIDCALYRASDLSRVVTVGGVAQAGVSAVQEADVADTSIGSGVYLLALSADNAIGHVIRNTNELRIHRPAGVLQQASAYPLPATADPATLASAFVPMFGLALRTLVA